MTHGDSRRSNAPLLVAIAWLAGCMLPSKSTGELDSEGESAVVPGEVGEGDGEASGPEIEDGDATMPVDAQWSHVVPTAVSDAWACDVEIDGSGRVAMAWRVVQEPGFPLGRTGIDLFEPDGTLVTSTAVDGQTFTSLAFASDGTLRARGVTGLGGGEYLQWVTALDAALDPTWSLTYPEQSGNGQCDWGWTGVLVDASDHIVTYDHASGSIVRRHGPDGSLLWERHSDGGPGHSVGPIALGLDGAVFHGGGFLYDDYDEVEVRKYSVDGVEQWMQVLPGGLDGLWGAADGGAYAFTKGLYTAERIVHRLTATGTLSWSSSNLGGDDLRVIAPLANDSGFFAVASDGLRRMNPTFDTIWTVPIEHADGWISAATVAVDEQTFAFGGSNTAGGHNYWLSVMATR